MNNTTFRNRTESLRYIVYDKEIPILNIYGESGIGKTSLLKEGIKQIKEVQQSARPLIIDIDLKAFAGMENTTLKKEKILEILLAQSEDLISQVRTKNYEQAAGEVVAKLLMSSRPVYIFLDTTETIQEDTAFWAWLEEYLLGPMVIHGEYKIKQIFAGRMPAPFQRHEIRRAFRLHRLYPLEIEEARKIIEEILTSSKPDIAPSEQVHLMEFILGFSFGHPGLTIKLAEYLAPRLPLEISPDLKKQVCEEVIDRYIKDELLGGIDTEWSQILRLASILDWFDPYILRKYTDKLLPEIAANKTEAFYTQGVARMRRQKSVIWSEQKGDRLHGIIRDIIRRYMQVESEFQPPEENLYRKANQVALSIMTELKQQALEAGENDTQEYDDQIQDYKTQAKG
jgi:hypothetical protein